MRFPALFIGARNSDEKMERKKKKEKIVRLSSQLPPRLRAAPSLPPGSWQLRAAGIQMIQEVLLGRIRGAGRGARRDAERGRIWVGEVSSGSAARVGAALGNGPAAEWRGGLARSGSAAGSSVPKSQPCQQRCPNIPAVPDPRARRVRAALWWHRALRQRRVAEQFLHRCKIKQNKIK